MYQKSVPKTRTRKQVPVSSAFDMQFGTEFLWYQFSVMNRTVLCFRASLWYTLVHWPVDSDLGWCTVANTCSGCGIGSLWLAAAATDTDWMTESSLTADMCWLQCTAASVT